jgi:outer membrane immunogenic protein
MHNIHILGAAVIILAMIASSGQAQTFSIEDGSSQAFSGGYIGLQAGYGQTRADAALTAPVSLARDLDDGAFTGGIFAGYGASIGRFVVGVELEGQVSGVEETARISFVNVTIEQNYSIGLSGRIGFAITNNLLLYGRAGWAVTRFEASATAVPIIDEDGNAWLDGPRAGGGIELAIGNGLFGRAEYSHTWYRDRDIVSGLATADISIEEDLFLAGIGYRF